VLPYSPLANGLLTGKLSPDRKFGEGDLRRNNRRFSAENLRRANDALERLRPVAERHRATIGQLVIAWTFSQPGITCCLCGARNADQAIDNALAGDIRLAPEDLAAVEEVGKDLAGI
jgi:methylglyoxal reductase